MKLFLQFLYKSITGSKNVVAKLLTLLYNTLAFINKLQKHNPTLFNVLKNLSGFVVGVLVYKLAKLGFKFDFFRLFELFINLVTLAYVINISDTLKNILPILSQYLSALKNIDYTIKGLFNSLDQFYKAFKASANDFANYIATKLKNGSSDPESTVPCEAASDEMQAGGVLENSSAPEAPASDSKQDPQTALSKYDKLITLAFGTFIVGTLVFMVFHGTFGPEAKDTANSIVGTIQDTVYISANTIKDTTAYITNPIYNAISNAYTSVLNLF
jgi:hypothetical protein